MTHWLAVIALAAGLTATPRENGPAPSPLESSTSIYRFREVNFSPTLLPLERRWPQIRVDPVLLPGIPLGNLNQQPWLLPPDAAGLPQMMIGPNLLYVPGGSRWW